MICQLCNGEFIPKVKLKELLFPGKIGRAACCEQCQNKFIRVVPGCPQCSRSNSGLCQDCLDWQKRYQGDVLVNHSLYEYNEIFHNLMVQYKRYGDYVLRLTLQDLIKKPLKSWLKDKNYDFYVALPTSPSHKERRQFETVEATFLDLLPLTKMLEKSDKVSSQGEKNRQERLATPQSFSFKFELDQIPENSRILLLDDIYTTGRTLYHAKDAIRKKLPDAKLDALTICR
ncbi:MAG: ComF family protein [Lactobacillus sp.]|nr:ComF family protein [Lactobacillus sp.]